MNQSRPRYKEWGIVLLLLGVLGVAIYGLGNALMPLLVSFVLAYLVFPLIKKLERHGLERSHAVFGVFAGLLLGVGLVLIIVIPILVSDASDFARDFPDMASRAVEKLEGVSGDFGYPLDLSKDSLQSYVQEHISELSGAVLKSLSQGVQTAFSSVVGWLVAILNVFLVPLFFFYVVSDFEKISRRICDLVPRSWRRPLNRYAAISNRVLSGYVRGQLTVALMLGTLYGIGLWAIGLKFGILIGFVSGLISVIPYAGFTIGFLTAMMIGLANYSGLGLLIGIVIVYSVVQGLEGTVITPRFVGNKVGLSSLATLLALIIGGNLLGFVGMLIAVPVAAIVKVALADLIKAYQETTLDR